MSQTYWKDIDIELNMKPSGDIVDMTNEDAINNSLRNIMETVMGTRRMLPTFAIGIYRLLFEPISPDTARSIGNMMLDAINRWETRIVVDNINVKVDADNNQYTVTVVYHVTSLTSDNSTTFVYNLKAR